MCTLGVLLIAVPPSLLKGVFLNQDHIPKINKNVDVCEPYAKV